MAMNLGDFILAYREKAAETKGRCFYCGKQTNKEGKEHYANYQTKDHVVPLSAKGTHTFVNRVCCCRKCNDVKEDLTLFEFKERSGIETFFAETLLGVKIDDLTDIREVTQNVLTNRKIEGRCLKFKGKKVIRTAPTECFSPSN
jgi:hypothetical protein